MTIDKLSRSKLIYFGLPDFAFYLAAIPVSLYLLFVYSRALVLESTEFGVGLAMPILAYFGFDPKGDNGPDKISESVPIGNW
jgi:hypothetical protein